MKDIEGMSDEQIAHLDHREVYNWVKSGEWGRPQFDKWVEELMVQSFGEGMAEALSDKETEDD